MTDHYRLIYPKTPTVLPLRDALKGSLDNLDAAELLRLAALRIERRAAKSAAELRAVADRLDPQFDSLGAPEIVEGGE